MIFRHLYRTFQQSDQTNAKNDGAKGNLLNIGVFPNALFMKSVVLRPAKLEIPGKFKSVEILLVF